MPQRSILRATTKNAFNGLKYVLPQTRSFDTVLAYLYFYAYQGRLPGQSETLNNHLFRLKTTDEIKDPLRTFISDKEFVKLFVKALVGDEYNIPTEAVLRSPEELDAYAFPHSCVIKATHSSRRIVLREAGEAIDLSRLRSWFRHNYYRSSREYNYKHLRPKIIVEPYIGSGEPLEEFKIFCRDGQPKAVRYFHDRYGEDRRFWLDLDLCAVDRDNAPEPPIARDRLDDMLHVARTLSARFSFIRVDILRHRDRIYLNELTNLHNNAGYVFDNPGVEDTVNAMLFG